MVSSLFGWFSVLLTTTNSNSFVFKAQFSLVSSDTHKISRYVDGISSCSSWVEVFHQMDWCLDNKISEYIVRWNIFQWCVGTNALFDNPSGVSLLFTRWIIGCILFKSAKVLATRSVRRLSGQITPGNTVRMLLVQMQSCFCISSESEDHWRLETN